MFTSVALDGTSPGNQGWQRASNQRTQKVLIERIRSDVLSDMVVVDCGIFAAFDLVVVSLSDT